MPSREGSAHILYDTDDGRVWLLHTDAKLLHPWYDFTLRELAE
jgi:hypothetical protein